ncbi:hypothetical protein Dimus_010970, partial [Dionaea muscipula]
MEEGPLLAAWKKGRCPLHGGTPLLAAMEVHGAGVRWPLLAWKLTAWLLAEEVVHCLPQPAARQGDDLLLAPLRRPLLTQLHLSTRQALVMELA